MFSSTLANLFSDFAGLRVTRTAVESIHESIREEDRRRTKRLHSKKPSLPRDPSSPLKPRRSIFSRATLRRKSSAATPFPEPTSPTEPHFELGAEPRAQLERIRTQANAAAEAEESARRQDRQDGKLGDKSSGVGVVSGLKKKKGKEKERRSVFVNLEGGATDPKGYERNKVRTSRYTLITFLPKVSGSARKFEVKERLTDCHEFWTESLGAI